jgi:hypothetical protein
VLFVISEDTIKIPIIVGLNIVNQSVRPKFLIADTKIVKNWQKVSLHGLKLILLLDQILKGNSYE